MAHDPAPRPAAAGPPAIRACPPRRHRGLARRPFPLAPAARALAATPWHRRRLPAPARALAGAAMLMDTPSLGMAGQPAVAFYLALLPASAVVADIVYVPRETPMLAAARTRALAAVDGLGMLLHQARPGFEAWFAV